MPKISSYPAGSPTDVDQFITARLGANKSITGTKMGEGWIEVTGTWTYASASTITVPTDATTKYQKGWGIRFKQGGGYKYMYMTTVAATLLTVNGGSDYSVANAGITDIAYAPNPHSAFGFPAYFNYAVTLPNTTLGNGSVVGRFVLTSNQCIYEARFTLGSTSAVGSNPQITLPIPASILVLQKVGDVVYRDVGTNLYFGILDFYDSSHASLYVINTGSSYSSLSLASATVPFTFGNTDIIDINGTYLW